MTAELIAVVLLILTACGDAPDINNTHWQLVSLNGQPVLDGVSVTLNREDGKLGGLDGCNTYGGSYTAKRSEFKTGTDLFSTMMYCNDAINNQATAYYLALSTSSKYDLRDQSLTLLDSTGTVLIEFNVVRK